MNRLETTGMEKCVRISMCDMRYPIMNNSEARGSNMHVFIYIYLCILYLYARHALWYTYTHRNDTRKTGDCIYVCVCAVSNKRLWGELDFISSVGRFLLFFLSIDAFSLASTISNYQLERSFIHASVSLHSNIGKCQRYFDDGFISNRRFAQVRVSACMHLFLFFECSKQRIELALRCSMHESCNDTVEWRSATVHTYSSHPVLLLLLLSPLIWHSFSWINRRRER